MFEILLAAFFSLFIIGIGVVFAYLGLRLIGDEIQNWRKAIASRKWPSSVGRIISSEVQSAYSGRTITHQPRAKYSYTVAGQNYTGERIGFAWREGLDRHASEKVVERYPPGQTVTVFYNPRQPQEATLDRNFSWPLFELFCGVLVGLCPGAVCSAMGISFLAEVLHRLELFLK